MKQYSIRIACVLFIAVISEPAFGTGNDNPTGVTGQYNGSITTAGSYDPYTGNATRAITDLTVTGAVGAYPLQWSRTLNTRNVTSPRAMGRGGWTHSYDWHIYLRRHTNPTHWNDETPDYHEGPDAVVYYPDGRQVPFEGAPGYDYAGAPEKDVSALLKHVGGDNYDLYLSDGGIVQFRLFNYWEGGIMRTGRAAQAIVDPYGVATTFSRDSAGRLSRVTEQAGRYLQINYTGAFITSVQAFASEGNLVETVSYVYGHLGSYLTQVNYADGAHAYYTYQGSNHGTTYAALIRTCDDVRYAGPMKKIEYVFMPQAAGIDFGQIKGEKYPGSATLVSQVSYPAYQCCPADDPAGFVRTETRADNQTRSFQYRPFVGGELASWSDFKNKWSSTTRIVEIGNPLVRRVNTDARTNPTTIEKTAHGKTNRLIHPDETYQAFVYDYSVNGYPYYLLIHGDELGRNTYYTRDPTHHRVTKIWYGFDPNNHLAHPTEEFTYNGFGQVETHTLKSGGTEHFRYDSRGLKKESWPPATPNDLNPEAHPTRYFYYLSGPNTDRLHYTTDPHGNSTWFEYNLRGQVTKVTHPDGSYTQSGYNPDGTLDWTADENHPGAVNDPSQRTRYIYDEYKRVTSVTNPMNETTTNIYAPWNGAGHLSHTTSSVYQTHSPMGKQVHHDYDPNFRRTITRAGVTADDAWTFFEYDEAGNLKKTTDPRWHETVFGYDSRNRQIWTDSAKASDRNSAGHTVNWDYDAVGNKIRETRADNAFRTWHYEAVNPLNRLSQTVDWRMSEAEARQTITYARDVKHLTEWMTDAKGAVYTFTFDELHRKRTAHYPPDATGASRSEVWYRDAVGNIGRHDTPAGNVRMFLYDKRNRQKESYWLHAPDWGHLGQRILTSYDPASRVTGITTKRNELFETSVSFGYDDANRQVSEEQTLAGHPMRRVETPRDPDGNRAFVHVPGSFMVRYDYTNRNQLAHIFDANGGPWFNFSYDAAGNVLKRQDAMWGVNDSLNVPSQWYDPMNRPVMWENTGAGDSFLARSRYQYDNVGREVATWRDEQSGKGERFYYSTTNQLTNVRYNADHVETGNPTNWSRWVDYGYTPDRLNRWYVNDNGNFSWVGVNALNQYTSTGEVALEYDKHFNLKAYDGLSANYDPSNRLVAASKNGTTAQFVYDGLGRCVKRTIESATTLIAYDGWKPVVEWDGVGNLRAWNVYGAGADEILWRYQVDVGHLRYHHDANGNVAFVLGGGGERLEKYSYDAFGQPTVVSWTGTTWDEAHPRAASNYGNRFLFQGREWVPELGIYDYRNRMYHPGLGRFLQTDPIGFDAGDMNLFRYCGDDPVNGTDPFGLENEVFSSLEGAIQKARVYAKEAAFGPTAKKVSERIQDSSSLTGRTVTYVPSKMVPVFRHGRVFILGPVIPGKLTKFYNESGNLTIMKRKSLHAQI